jgi:hypothetical protein
LNQSGRQNDFDIETEAPSDWLSLTVKSEWVPWKSSLLRDGDARVKLVLLKHTGAFAIPLADDDPTYKKSCKLACQNRQVDAKPVTLGREMNVAIYANSIKQLNLKYTLSAQDQTVPRRRRQPEANGSVENGDGGQDGGDGGGGGGENGALSKRRAMGRGTGWAFGRGRGKTPRNGANPTTT